MMTKQVRERDPIDPEEEFDATALKYSKNKGARRRGSDLLIVTTFCGKDVWLLKKRIEWMRFLGVRPTHDMVLVGDADVNDADLQELGSLHREMFRTVVTYKLKGQSQGQGWPRGTNSAFRNTARYLQGLFKQKFDNMNYRGWFYFESDMTPLKMDFCPLLNQIYIQNRLPFMGVVGEITTKSGNTIRHMNGGGIYPFDPLFFSPEIMLTENVPWDVAGLTGQPFMKTVHDLGHTQYSMHFSTSRYERIEANKFRALKTPHGSPAFEVTCDIFPTHILHHGCKDGSMIDWLMGVKKPVETKVIPPITPTAPPLPKITIPIKRKAQKKGKKEKLPTSSPEVIREAAKNGMKWKDLIKTHRVMPKELKRILEG